VITLSLIAFKNKNLFSKPKPRPVKPMLIPAPAKYEVGNKVFIFNNETQIQANISNPDLEKLALYTKKELAKVSGIDYKIQSLSKYSLNAIQLKLVNNEDLGDEGYNLISNESKISIVANTRNGLFYGIQSLLQLLPVKKSNQLTFPEIKIQDKPRFKWRGVMLDCSRHFFSKDFIKKYIDLLASYKINTFQWHLIDDQGWRMEVKKHPKLTEIGAWRVDREDEPRWYNRKPPQEGEKATYGGFYTHEDIKEIVQYAAERAITVVPEIEMPAHVISALAAIPELSCKGAPLKVPVGGVPLNTDIYCAGNDKVFSFLEDVLKEVISLFPSKYIHIGGDEANKRDWKNCKKCNTRIKEENLKDENELQSYLIKRIEKFLQKYDRRLIGWDEILEGGLAPEATIMSWRGVEGGIAAAKSNHFAIMTPTTHCYFDYHQKKNKTSPLDVGDYLPLEKVYSYEPIPKELDHHEAKYILGVQANLWTEYMSTPARVEYMTLPRLFALSETAWSPKENKDLENFKSRVLTHNIRVGSKGYNYCKEIDTQSSFENSYIQRNVKNFGRNFTFDYKKILQLNHHNNTWRKSIPFNKSSEKSHSSKATLNLQRC
jgi:hexosaminidase